MADINIAVISDLHCRYGSGKSIHELNTYLISDEMPSDRHPIYALQKEIEDSLIPANNKVPIAADILLCPGDITDRIDKQGLIAGWDFLKQIQTSLNASLLVGTVGNHDVDSRNEHKKPSPFDLIKSLAVKGFPTTDKTANSSFWEKNYCIIDNELFVLLVINSSYSHFDSERAKECVITTEIINQIDSELQSINLAEKHKICMLHHHPIKHSNISYKDNDSLDKGEILMAMLNKHKFSIVIHGHKHDPRLTNYNKLAVFAAGSFSSIMNILDLGADNTFHLITLKENSNKGIIKTWVYGPASGWTQKHGTYFPTFTGFGNTTPIKDLAYACAKWFEESGKDFISYEDLIHTFPDIQFLTPAEQSDINAILDGEYKLAFSPNMPDKPGYLIKRV